MKFSMSYFPCRLSVVMSAFVFFFFVALSTNDVSRQLRRESAVLSKAQLRGNLCDYMSKPPTALSVLKIYRSSPLSVIVCPCETLIVNCFN